MSEKFAEFPLTEYVWEDGFRPRRWQPGSYVDRYTVADSWRHSRGRTNRLDLHLDRFEETAGPLPEGFVEEMVAMASDGELFPRIALYKGELILQLRFAPLPRDTTSLTYADAPDPRKHPLVKGPDFIPLRLHRREYMDTQTDDIAITDSSGAMVEASNGALVAWDGETLVTPEGVYLPSITLRQVTERARWLGVPVRKEALTVESCCDRPLWYLNSLHGISPVSEIRTAQGTIIPPAHAATEQWREWWWSGFTPATAVLHR